MTVFRLAERSVLRLSSRDGVEDARDFLQGLVTNDVAGALPVWTGLLTPQGKTAFDFLVWPGADGELLIDCEAGAAPALAKRLTLYRLRRPIEIEPEMAVSVLWSREPFDGAVPDPRLAALGWRALGAAGDAREGDAPWRAHRLSLGMPEGEGELSDILWLETNAAELHGVRFDKGCYIGQENTARMNWRQKVNRRLVVVPIDRSQEKRRVAAYPELGLAVDHLRLSDIAPEWVPDWIKLAEKT